MATSAKLSSNIHTGAASSLRGICNSVQSKLPQAMTATKVQKLALYTFALGAVAVGGHLIKAAITGVAYANPLAGFSLFAIAAIAFGLAKNIKDYKDPQALAKMQEKAEGSSFSALNEEHGIRKVSEHNIVSPEVLAEKFKAELDSGKFLEILSKVTPEEMKEHQLLSKHEFRQYLGKALDSVNMEDLSLKHLEHLKSFEFLSDEDKAHISDACLGVKEAYAAASKAVRPDLEVEATFEDVQASETRIVGRPKIDALNATKKEHIEPLVECIKQEETKRLDDVAEQERLEEEARNPIMNQSKQDKSLLKKGLGLIGM